jgi:sugar phosphate isomerase/epimerase
VGHWKTGLQLYTLREETGRDFKGTLEEVARLGYEGVEFAGYGGIPADEMKSLLGQLGLTAIASHVSLQRLRDGLEEEIAYNRTIGSGYIIVPYLSEELRKDEPSWQAIFAELEELGKQIRQAGIGFGYHNHEFEFQAVVKGQSAFDAMLAATSENVSIELDTCWVQVADEDPLAYIRRLQGRMPLIHLKDYGDVDEGKKDTVELGAGEIMLEKIVREAENAEVEWIIIEQDRTRKPALDSVRISIEWLNNLCTRTGGEFK